MEGGDHGDNKKIPIEETLQENRFPYAPKSYKILPTNRPSLNPVSANLVVIDLAGLDDPAKRPMIVKEIGNACRETGFFQIINHGLTQMVLDKALEAAFEFFNLPITEKARYMSNDVHKPVRYETSIKAGEQKIQSGRVFLKLYAHPLNEWIEEWPSNPPDYREKMGDYAIETRLLAINVMGAITESLGIGPKYIDSKMKDGMQVLAVNCYPQCHEPRLTLRLPPHSDHSCITIVHQSSHGLEIMDASNGTWQLVPDLHGSLQVYVGDHVEVLSNGLYKSMVHRVTVNEEKTRVSIASFHSMGIDEKMTTAEELITDEHPRKYKESSFRDFLNFLSSKDMKDGKSFLESLTIE